MPGRPGPLICCVLFILCVTGICAAETAYTVSGGETLFAIAKKSKVPVEILKTYNGISDPSRLKVGALIRIPSVHTVVKGETLYGIARSAAVPLAQMLTLNNLTQRIADQAGGQDLHPRAGGGGRRAGNEASAHHPPARCCPSVDSASGNGSRGLGPVTRAARPRLAASRQAGRVHGKFTGLVFHGTRGDRVVSATDGEVKSVMPYWGWGKTVIIKSPDGTFFLYAGNEEILVNVGDRVDPGHGDRAAGGEPAGRGSEAVFLHPGNAGAVHRSGEVFLHEARHERVYMGRHLNRDTGGSAHRGARAGRSPRGEGSPRAVHQADLALLAAHRGRRAGDRRDRSCGRARSWPASRRRRRPAGYRAGPTCGARASWSGTSRG